MATNLRIAKLLIAVAFVAGGRQAIALAQPESTKVAKDVPANGDDDTDRELLQRIEADWDQRRKAFSQVKYVAKGEARFMRGCYNDIAPEDRQAVGGGDLPAEDQTFPTHRTLYLDVDRGKARKEWSEHSFFVEGGKVMSSELANVFDGATMRQRRLDRASVGPHIDLLIPGPDRFRYFFFDYNDYALLCAHGIIPRVGNMAVESISAPPGTGEYALHRTVVSDGRPMAVLRTPSVKGAAGTFAELWVDVERQSAVVRWATYDNNMVVCRLDIGYGKGERGWWPRKWQLTYFRFGETAIGSVYRYQVSQFEGNPAVGPELFTEEPKPGMVVRDVSRGVVYRIGE